MTITETAAAWTPDLSPDDGALHQRLAAAMRRDIAGGRLAAGDRLPTHRELAFRLGLGVGTVTRAYAEAEAAGLIASRVGRGSFVAGPVRPASGGSPVLDLARNLAPAGPAAARLGATLARLARRPDLADVLAYAPIGGVEGHRRSAAAWLRRACGLESAAADRLLVCGGAQVGLALALGRLCRPGDTILAEAGTFFGLRDLAGHAGWRLAAVAMDGEGLDPEALDRAAAVAGARVLYALPTFQNPTGRTMSLARRREIAQVARARGLWIVEDDVYGALAPDPLPPLAMFAPERTAYVGGVSKVLGPGLRTGFVVAPDAAFMEDLIRAARATALAPPAIGALIAAAWIDDGQADQIAAEARAELADRRALAAAILGPAVEMGADGSPHLWAPMGEAAAERLARRALREGVEVTAPSGPILDPALLSGVRICLGAAPDSAALASGLGRLMASGLADGRAAGEGVL